MIGNSSSVLPLAALFKIDTFGLLGCRHILACVASLTHKIRCNNTPDTILCRIHCSVDLGVTSPTAHVRCASKNCVQCHTTKAGAVCTPVSTCKTPKCIIQDRKHVRCRLTNVACCVQVCILKSAAEHKSTVLVKMQCRFWRLMIKTADCCFASCKTKGFTFGLSRSL